MHAPALRIALSAIALLAAACVPPRERVVALSSDGQTRVTLELRPAGIDSVLGTGTLQMAGRPHSVEVAGRWNDVGDGIRSLEATLQSDTAPRERWAIEWSTSTLDGSIRHTGDAGVSDAVAIRMP
jgi:hypothetical protein